ncbi:MAG: sugar-binding domain-containing protein, partial [Anaerolineales bacterium]
QAARAFNGTPYFLLVPMLVGSKELRDALLQDPSTRDVSTRWERISYACVGIGAVPPVEGQIVYIGQENLSDLIEREAVGDICARYFNFQGKFLDAEFNGRLLGVSLDHLRRAKNVLAVAVGIEKSKAVRGALCSRLITHLFVDEALAQVLLQE